MKICKNCNIEYQDNMKFCPKCGTKLESKPNVCPNCGTEYEEGQKFCSECGSKLLISNSEQVELSCSQQAESIFQKGVKHYNKGREGVDDPNFSKAFECFMKSAKAGNVEAQFYLGTMYEYGEGVAKNIIKSNEWYSRAFVAYEHAVEQGVVESMVGLGDCYLHGRGVEEDTNKALELYKKAFNNGCAKAGVKLGECYQYGIGVEENKAKAVEYFRAAAVVGCDEVFEDLGHAYYYGLGVDVDKIEALKWLKKAVESGISVCGYEIGECYRLGEGVEKDEEIASEWYKRAADDGQYKAMFMLAEYSLDKGNFGVALAWYKKALESTYEWDNCFKNKINKCLQKYFNLDGTPSEAAKKVCKIEKNSLAFDAVNEYNLGERLLDAFNDENKNKAMACFKRAAEAGYDKALEKLIRLYVDEIEDNDNEWEDEDVDEFFADPFYSEKSNVINDDGDAFDWFLKAAEKGNAKASFMIGECYYHGWDVVQDKKIALEWYRKAAESGYPLYRRCVRITELELRFNVVLRGDTFLVKDGTEEILHQLLDPVIYDIRDVKAIFIPSSVTTIAAGSFNGCWSLETVICEAPQNITVSSMKDMFSFCRKLKDISFLSDWNISNVKSMENCFYDCSSLEDISPLAKWDVSNVELMTLMFCGCESLKDISPLSKWNLFKATNIDQMFARCFSLTNITALQNWSKFSNKMKRSTGIIRDCNAITDISPLKKWGLTETEIVQNMIGRHKDTSLSDYKKKNKESTTPKISTIVPNVDSKYVDGTLGIEPIEKCIPHVFFIKAVSFDITYPDGKRQQTSCGEGGMPSWTGTGFLLSDGRFVTARHVVEAWAFPAGGGEVDETMVALNIVANNGGKVVAKFEAISSNGTKIQFSSDQCVINHRNDQVQLTENGAKMVVARMSYDDTDYAYFHSGLTFGLGFNVSASTSLTMRTELVVLGFPLGIGANSETDINPIYGSGIVAKSGLQNGVILTTDTNYEQGNSGGPVFITNGNGDLEVIGLVSAGAGRTMGFIVPIAAVK